MTRVGRWLRCRTARSWRNGWRRCPARRTGAGDRGLLPRADGRRARRSRLTAAGSSSRSRPGSSRTTARAPRCRSWPPTGRARRGACCTTAATSATPVVDRTGQLRYTADRQRFAIDPASTNQRACHRGRCARRARSRAPTAPGWRSRKTSPRRKPKWPTPASSSAATRSASRASPSTGRTSSVTASRSRRRTCARGLRPHCWCSRPRAAARRRWSISICGRRISRGTPTADRSRLPPIPTGATSSSTRAPISTRSRPTGVLTRLTNDGYVYGETAFSPDGKYLSFVRSFGTDMIIQQKLNHGGARDIFIRPASGGDPINLTASWDLDPENPQWSPDSRSRLFHGRDRRRVASVPGRGGSHPRRGRAGHEG